MTKSQLLRKNWRGLAKKSCAGELYCTPAELWTPLCSMPCTSGARWTDRCIRCNRSAEPRRYRWKARFLRLKGKHRRAGRRGRTPGRPDTRPEPVQEENLLPQGDGECVTACIGRGE